MAVDIGQAAVDTVVAEGQPRVVDAQQMQDGRLKIVDMDGSWRDAV